MTQGLVLDTDARRRARYSQGGGIQRIVPAAVARPRTTAELRVVLDAAAQAGLAVTPRGAGSAMDGSNVGAGVVVDLSGFEFGRCTVDPVARLATTSPSAPLAVLREAAGAHGLRVPPDPSSGGFATLGGMVSTNASGARSLRYGSVRRWVQALVLETVDGPLALARSIAPDPDHPVITRWRECPGPLIATHHDEIVARFPKVRKNSAGYALDAYLASGDLLDLVIGAEGTLGIVTDITWKLDAVPQHRASLRVALRDASGLVGAIDTLRAFDPSTIEFLDASFLTIVADRVSGVADADAFSRAAGLLLADFEGDNVADVDARARDAGDAVRRFGVDVRIATTSREIESLWEVRHGASPVLAGLTDGRRSLQVIEDGCVPAEHLGEYLDAVRAICADERIDAVIFGHAGDGHLHVNLLPDVREPSWLDRVRAIYQRTTDTVVQLGGTPSGEHGTGRLRAGVMHRVYGAAVIECFRAVKGAFDPEARFNPGVILGHDDPFATLKVGVGAAPVPDDIDTWLTAIEREARWGDARWDDAPPTR